MEPDIGTPSLAAGKLNKRIPASLASLQSPHSLACVNLILLEMQDDNGMVVRLSVL
jgi:hypothetical protein